MEDVGEGIQLMAKKKQDQSVGGKRVEPALLVIFYVAVAYLLKWALPVPFEVPAAIRLAGFGLVVIGFLLGVGALFQFRKARASFNSNDPTKLLVTTGVYRFTRNPIYLGFLLMVIGLPLNMNSYWGVVVSPLFITTINKLVIEREEEYLEKKFSKEFTEYKVRVRRWL